MAEVTLRIEAISVVGRHRKDLGDLKALAADIEANGLISPIAVTSTGRLLAGERRLEACRLLGRETIQAHVIDTFDDAALALRIERSENTERKAMTPSELVSLGKALEALERPKADARSGRRTDRSLSTSGPDGQEVDGDEFGTVRSVVARALGVSEGIYQRAAAVVAAADAGDAIAAEAVADMDAGRTTVTGAYDRVKNAKPVRTGRQRNPTIDDLAAQRRAIGSAEAALSGLAHAMRQIEALHEGITSEEAARWVGSLLESRRAITVLLNLLKERSSGTA